MEEAETISMPGLNNNLDDYDSIGGETEAKEAEEVEPNTKGVKPKRANTGKRELSSDVWNSSTSALKMV